MYITKLYIRLKITGNGLFTQLKSHPRYLRTLYVIVLFAHLLHLFSV